VARKEETHTWLHGEKTSFLGELRKDYQRRKPPTEDSFFFYFHTNFPSSTSGSTHGKGSEFSFLQENYSSILQFWQLPLEKILDIKIFQTLEALEENVEGSEKSVGSVLRGAATVGAKLHGNPIKTR